MKDLIDCHGPLIEIMQGRVYLRRWRKGMRGIIIELNFTESDKTLLTIDTCG